MGANFLNGCYPNLGALECHVIGELACPYLGALS
jgi:hypothetical protein